MGVINLYCDESSHLYFKNDNAMAFGEVECPKDKIKDINEDIKKIKIKHGVSKWQELKWQKISKSNMNLYEEVITYFFDNNFLNSKILLIKNIHDLKFLDQEKRDIFYYKMIYKLIIRVLDPSHMYNIFLDKKDTLSAKKINQVKKFLNAKKIDYNVTNTILNVQAVRSFESNLFQIADILIGALLYNYNNRNKNIGKLKIVELIKQKTGLTLLSSTLIQERKFNICILDGKIMKSKDVDNYV